MTKYLPPQELIEQGYLQEANRTFFHPLGLALEVSIGDDGNASLAIQDHRNDPEGVTFQNLDTDSLKKSEIVSKELHERGAARIKALGYVYQPIPRNEQE